jgi:hypothetical protein
MANNFAGLFKKSLKTERKWKFSKQIFIKEKICLKINNSLFFFNFLKVYFTSFNLSYSTRSRNENSFLAPRLTFFWTTPYNDSFCMDVWKYKRNLYTKPFFRDHTSEKLWKILVIHKVLVNIAFHTRNKPANEWGSAIFSLVFYALITRFIESARSIFLPQLFLNFFV